MKKTPKHESVTFNLPKALLALIDDDAKERMVSRSDILRSILVQHYEGIKT